MKRQNTIDVMNYMFSNEEERLKDKKRRELQLKHEEEAKKRSIVVNNIFDLTEKYEDYDIKVDSVNKIVKLRNPIEVKYLAQFRYECNCLGFKCEIGDRSIEDLYYKYSHI